MSEIQKQLEQLVAEQVPETAESKCGRYEKTLRAIAASELTGVDFGDWVQAACEDALQGIMPECPRCRTFIHEGACVPDDDI